MSNPIFNRRVNLDKERAYELWSKGMTDLEIAHELGVTDSAVGSWRRRNGGLTANHKPKVQTKKASKNMSKLSQDAAEARARGMNYGMYKAQQYDAIPTSRTAWQRRGK